MGIEHFVILALGEGQKVLDASEFALLRAAFMIPEACYPQLKAISLFAASQGVATVADGICHMGSKEGPKVRGEDEEVTAIETIEVGHAQGGVRDP